MDTAIYYIYMYIHTRTQTHVIMYVRMWIPQDPFPVVQVTSVGTGLGLGFRVLRVLGFWVIWGFGVERNLSLGVGFA